MRCSRLLPDPLIRPRPSCSQRPRRILCVKAAGAVGGSGEQPPWAPLRPDRAGLQHHAGPDRSGSRRIVLVVLFSGELGMILVEVCRRQLFDVSFLWSEEVSRIILLTMAFIGGPLAYRAQSHAAVSFITRLLRPRLRSHDRSRHRRGDPGHRFADGVGFTRSLRDRQHVRPADDAMEPWHHRGAFCHRACRSSSCSPLSA